MLLQPTRPCAAEGFSVIPSGSVTTAVSTSGESGFDGSLEEAAADLGARPATVFRRITLPSIRRGLAYGVTLTTARVLGEFGAVAIVSGAIAGKTETYTLFISDSIDNLQPQSAYVGAVALCLAALIVLTLLTLTDRNRDAWHGTAAA